MPWPPWLQCQSGSHAALSPLLSAAALDFWSFTCSSPRSKGELTPPTALGRELVAQPNRVSVIPFPGHSHCFGVSIGPCSNQQDQREHLLKILWNKSFLTFLSKLMGHRGWWPSLPARTRAHLKMRPTQERTAPRDTERLRVLVLIFELMDPTVLDHSRPIVVV